MGWQNEVRATQARALRNAAKRCGVPREEWASLTRYSSRAPLERVAGLCAATSGDTARQTAAKAAAAGDEGERGRWGKEGRGKEADVRVLDASSREIKLTILRGRWGGVEASRRVSRRVGKGEWAKAQEGAPLEGGAPVQC